ncbi:MAG: substrate-binding domain-containing protein [Thermomicrobiales bacterium]
MAETPLRIFAPGSLWPVQAVILAGFRREAPGVAAEFAPPAYSGVLAQQILAGAPADVFISANMRYVEDLHAAGLIAAPSPLARNRLLLLARRGLEPPMRGVADLARPGLRLVLPPAGSDPLGAYAAAMLDEAGLTAAIIAKRERGEVLETLGALREGLASGAVDAAIVYGHMAAMFPAAEAVSLPSEQDWHDRVVFGIGAVTRAAALHPAAATFVDWMRHGEGRQILLRAGFTPLA